MPRRVLGAMLLVALVVVGCGPKQRKGLQDAVKSLTHLTYYDIRDMRRSVSLSPQKVVTLAPDSSSVPITGREHVIDREILSARLTNPVPMSDESVARGEKKFQTLCVPCHGKSMVGDGPVAAQFMPPPDLLGAGTRARSDGYIYSYIRNGGAVMPTYGPAVSALEAWDLIHYIRRQQKASPR